MQQIATLISQEGPDYTKFYEKVDNKYYEISIILFLLNYSAAISSKEDIELVAEFDLSGEGPDGVGFCSKENYFDYKDGKLEIKIWEEIVNITDDIVL